MIVFLFFYLPVLLLVLAASAAVIYLSVLSICWVASEVSFFSVCSVVACPLAVYFLVWPICKASFSPFFVILSDSDHKMLEITRSDAPELFSLIHRVAELTNNPDPVHVYIDENVNAGVFFDTRFWSIFFPVKKNLIIGLGLFQHTSLGEVAACLAHEFGHFSQKTMRWGVVVYVLNELIKNLMGTNKQWIGIVNYLISFPWIGGYGIVLSLMAKAFGWTLYGLTIGYQKVMDLLYAKIQLSHLELSRKMEFEADAVAASIMGSKTFISFGCKVDYLSTYQPKFLNMIEQQLNNDEIISDYWYTIDSYFDYIASVNHCHVDYRTMLTHLITAEHHNQLKAESIYSSHPSWTDRLEVVKALDNEPQLSLPQEAWSVIPFALKQRMSEELISRWSGLVSDKSALCEIPREDISSRIEGEFYWINYEPYFSDPLMPIALDECEANDDPVDPADPSNLAVCSRYVGAYEDLELAKAIQSSRSHYHVVSYRGKDYRPADLPMAEIKATYEQAAHEASVLAGRLCSYAMSLSSDPSAVRAAYRNLFYADAFLHELEAAVIPLYDKAAIQLSHSTDSNNSHQFGKIRSSLVALDNALHDLLHQSYNEEYVESVADQESIQRIAQYTKQRYGAKLKGDSINGKDIALLFEITALLRNLHLRLKENYRMVIIDTFFGKTTAFLPSGIDGRMIQVSVSDGPSEEPEDEDVDPAEMAKEYLEAAEQGDADAQVSIGDCYYNGDGVEQSYAEAVKWYRLAAEQGNLSAMNYLGYCYYAGNGVTQSFEKAVNWYRQTAEQDDLDGMNGLAWALYELEQYEEAEVWVNTILDNEPNDYNTIELLALLRVKSGQKDVALTLLQKALSLANEENDSDAISEIEDYLADIQPNTH